MTLSNPCSVDLVVFPARFALSHVQGCFFGVPVCLLFQHEETSRLRCNTQLLPPKDVLANFCATQQFPDIFEVAAQFCEFVRNFTRQVPASNALAKVSKNGKDILANRHISYTGMTKVALVEFPTVNMFGFFFCTPVPLRILAWSFVVPRSHFHPPKASTSYRFESSDN